MSYHINPLSLHSNPEIPKLTPLQMEKVRVTNPLISDPGLQIPIIVLTTCDDNCYQ